MASSVIKSNIGMMGDNHSNLSELFPSKCVGEGMNITIRFMVAALCSMLLESANATATGNELARAARITRTQAEHIALAKVPHGRISAAELEREHGKLIWSFDIAKPGTRDISEVQVDAKSGQIVSIKSETPEDQAAEAAADKKKH
jgi:Peptidase propeptide and YPEB domain